MVSTSMTYSTRSAKRAQSMPWAYSARATYTPPFLPLSSETLPSCASELTASLTSSADAKPLDMPLRRTGQVTRGVFSSLRSALSFTSSSVIPMTKYLLLKSKCGLVFLQIQVARDFGAGNLGDFSAPPLPVLVHLCEFAVRYSGGDAYLRVGNSLLEHLLHALHLVAAFQQIAQVSAVVFLHLQRNVLKQERTQTGVLQALHVDQGVLVIEVFLDVPHGHAAPKNSAKGDRAGDLILEREGEVLLLRVLGRMVQANDAQASLGEQALAVPGEAELLRIAVCIVG